MVVKLSPIGKKRIARGTSKCKVCWKPITEGEPIVCIHGPHGKGAWVHLGCESGKPSAAGGGIDPAQVRGIVREELASTPVADTDAEAIRIIVKEELANAPALIKAIEVRKPDGAVNRIEGKVHPQFEDVLTLAACRKNILLVGPAGSGKTHLAALVAEALGLTFGFISCSAGMSEGQLLGRLLPTGEAGQFTYNRSDFIRCYEEGGVFLFDEIDAADSNTLLVINAALANGHVALPNRIDNPVAKRHPDFVCIGAANTFGTGADRQYVGRNQLDESTLDRFRIGQIEMDYDADLERALCPDDELRNRLQAIRAGVRASRIRRVVSTRFLRDAHEMRQMGWTIDKIEGQLFRGWSPDEIGKAKTGR